MANKFDQIAEKKKQAALAKQDEDVERFAKKVAGEVLGGIGDLSLKESVAALATTVAQAVVVSNEQIDLSLKDNFSRLLSAVKDNKPDDSSQVELSMKIGESLANLEKKFDDSKLSPEINLTAITQEELRTELSALLARLPQDSQRIVTVAYENASADKYLNVRLTDGIKFYKAGGASVVAGGGGSTVDTSSLATEAKQDTLIGHIDGVETLLGTIDADTGNIDANAGATGDAAASVGGTGTISAKLRLITSQLNDLNGNTNGIETLLSAIAAYVDDLESLLATSNANTGAIATDAAAIEALLTTIDGRVDGVETLLTAIDSHVDGIEGSVDGIETAIASTNTKLDSEIANSAAIAASASVLDDWDESDRAKTNIIVGQAGVQGASGAVSANTQRVVLATDVALPAGTNNIGDVNIASAVSATLDHGSNQDIDTTAEQITSTSFACKFGVTLKADAANTGIIYVGLSDVTASGTAATDGFPLSPGETLTLEVTNPNLLYAIASANNQKIFWVAV